MVSMTLCVEMLVVSITVRAWRWSIYVGGQYSCMCVGGRRVCELYILQHLLQLLSNVLVMYIKPKFPIFF